MVNSIAPKTVKKISLHLLIKSTEETHHGFLTKICTFTKHRLGRY